MFTLKDSIYNHCKKYKSRKHRIQLVVSRENSAKAFKTEKISLYFIALLVSFLVVFPWLFAIAFRRHHGNEAFLNNLSPHLIALVGLIHKHIDLLRQPLHSLKQLLSLRRIMVAAWRQRENHSRTVRCGDHMNFGGEASAGTPDALLSSFFKAPVPSGCTLTVVLSRQTASIFIWIIPSV